MAPRPPLSFDRTFSYLNGLDAASTAALAADLNHLAKNGRWHVVPHRTRVDAIRNAIDAHAPGTGVRPVQKAVATCMSFLQQKKYAGIKIRQRRKRQRLHTTQPTPSPGVLPSGALGAATPPLTSQFAQSSGQASSALRASTHATTLRPNTPPPSSPPVPQTELEADQADGFADDMQVFNDAEQIQGPATPPATQTPGKNFQTSAHTNRLDVEPQSESHFTDRDYFLLRNAYFRAREERNTALNGQHATEAMIGAMHSKHQNELRAVNDLLMDSDARIETLTAIGEDSWRETQQAKECSKNLLDAQNTLVSQISDHVVERERASRREEQHLARIAELETLLVADRATIARLQAFQNHFERIDKLNSDFKAKQIVTASGGDDSGLGDSMMSSPKALATGNATQ